MVSRLKVQYLGTDIHIKYANTGALVQRCRYGALGTWSWFQGLRYSTLVQIYTFVMPVWICEYVELGT